MSEDKVDINTIIRQIQNLQAGADRLFNLSTKSKSGKSNFNEGLLRQGQELLKQADDLIEQNLIPILQQLNPSQVGAALSAAGASAAFTAEVTQALTAARLAIAAGALSTAQIVAAINIAVPILCAIVAAGICALLYKLWLDKKIEKESNRLVQEYERQVSRSKHIPFQPRFIPQRAGR